MAKVPFRERYRVSRQIFGQTMQMLGSQRDLWVFPVLAWLSMLPFIALAITAMVFAFTQHDLGWLLAVGKWMDQAGPAAPFAFLLLMPVLMLVMYPFMVLGSLFNAALVFAAHERLEGRPGRKREAWRRALGQLGPIARFNFVAMLVTGALSVVGQLLNKLRLVPFLGRFVQTLGAFAWAAAAYFVIPILVVERERSALGALRSSVGLARQQWGKSVAGIVTINLVFTVPIMAVALLMFVPIFAFSAGAGSATMLLWMGIVLGIFFLAVLVTSVISGAAQALYQTALYRYARTGVVSLPYTPETLVDSWSSYQNE